MASAERTIEKLEHATAMHRRAVTRLKRAKTIEKKWLRRVKYYKKAADAIKRGETPPPEPKPDPELQAFELEEG